MRYFSVTAGCTVPRFGTDVFIGAVRSKDGMVFDEEKVVRIPVAEVLRYNREYRNALRRKEIVERSVEDWHANQAAQVAAEPELNSDPADPPEDAGKLSSKSKSRRRRRSGGKGSTEA